MYMSTILIVQKWILYSTRKVKIAPWIRPFVKRKVYFTVRCQHAPLFHCSFPYDIKIVFLLGRTKVSAK